MKGIITIFAVLVSFALFGQNNTTVKSDSVKLFKKRVLENAEIDILASFYKQQGKNAAVTGGIGSEELTNLASSINVAIPIGDDGVLTIDATISAYSSASSSNLNPFKQSSTDGGDDDDDDDDDDDKRLASGASSGGGSGGGTAVTANSPWVASSSEAKKDIWYGVNIGYSHSSDDRNTVISTNFSAATEYDYNSLGGSVGITKLFNKKNTELSFGVDVFFDKWLPQYPAEINHYRDAGGDLESGFFNGTDILDKNGNPIDKTGPIVWQPNTNGIDEDSRNTFALSMSLSQILGRRTQVAVFFDPTLQKGWLANPMQRVYFSDVDNYYIGNPSSVYYYDHPSNTDVFQLADDIERLPATRLKFPIAVRMSHYINEFMILKLYYRYYFDDWGVKSNTINVELPIKVGDNFTFYPNYRFYNQSAAKYFNAYDEALSSSEFYTSDYDLSKFISNQYGLGIKYTDRLTKLHLWKVAFKSMSLNYNYYRRNIAFDAHIVSLNIKFIIN